MYFVMHSMVHKIESIRFIHKFHHLFIKNIPSIGNSVSFLEFQIMYVLPFLTSMFLLEPNVKTINVGIFTISFLNSLIHSSELKKIKWIPLLVSPKTVSCEAKSPSHDNTNLVPILLISIFSAILIISLIIF